MYAFISKNANTIWSLSIKKFTLVLSMFQAEQHKVEILSIFIEIIPFLVVKLLYNSKYQKFSQLLVKINVADYGEDFSNN